MRAVFQQLNDSGELDETWSGHVHGHEVRLVLDHEHLEATAGPSGRELKIVYRETGDVEITWLPGMADRGRDLAIVPTAIGSNSVLLRSVERPSWTQDLPADRP